jgi:hypothetical protein
MFKLRVICTGLTDYLSILGVLPVEVSTATDYRTKEFAKECRDFLREGIKKRRFPMPDLNEAYRLRRAYPGRPPLYNTGEYVKGIDVVRDKEGYRLAPSKKYQKAARKLEWGDAYVAARPHWRPTEEYARAHMNKVGENVIKGLSISGGRR